MWRPPPAADVVLRVTIGVHGGPPHSPCRLRRADTTLSTGRRHFFDINPFSNFVSHPVELLGFDPTERFVEFLLR